MTSAYLDEVRSSSSSIGGLVMPSGFATVTTVLKLRATTMGTEQSYQPAGKRERARASRSSLVERTGARRRYSLRGEGRPRVAVGGTACGAAGRLTCWRRTPRAAPCAAGRRGHAGGGYQRSSTFP